MDSSVLPLLVYNALSEPQTKTKDQIVTLSGDNRSYLAFRLDSRRVGFPGGFAAVSAMPIRKFWDGGADLQIWMSLPENAAWREAHTVGRVWTTSVRRATADEVREFGGEQEGHVAFIRELRWQGIENLAHPAAWFVSRVLEIAAQQARCITRSLYWVPLSALPLD